MKLVFLQYRGGKPFKGSLTVGEIQFYSGRFTTEEEALQRSMVESPLFESRSGVGYGLDPNCLPDRVAPAYRMGDSQRRRKIAAGLFKKKRGSGSQHGGHSTRGTSRGAGR